jgi:hypothetical protein
MILPEVGMRILRAWLSRKIVRKSTRHQIAVEATSTLPTMTMKRQPATMKHLQLLALHQEHLLLYEVPHGFQLILEYSFAEG